MEAAKARAPSKSTGVDGPNSIPASITPAENMNTAVDDSATAVSSSGSGIGIGGNVSEDVLLFGARSSHLFDNIAIAIDSLLTEEVATLPLLPRKLTEQEMRLHQQQKDGTEGNTKTKQQPPQTGEQKLIAHLRKAYKKNIDAAETYCNRNIFTVQHHSKTKRRQIMEQYFDTVGGNSNAGETATTTTTNTTTTTTTTTTEFVPLPDGMELPSPEHIMNMDREILETRQRIQHAKQRRIQQTRQLGRLEQANQLLVGVLEALQMIEKVDDATSSAEKSANDDDGDNIASLMQSLKQAVLNAMEGHEELKIWNVRAEEVLQLLDQIKIDREEMMASGGGTKNQYSNGTTSRGNNASGSKGIAEREEDERRRKNTLQEMGATHGTREQVASLLDKLRGN